MAQPDVLADQVLQHPRRAGAVGQGVQHLQDDPVAVVDDAEKQVVAVEVVQVVAGWQHLFGDRGTQVALFEVVPEHAATQHRVVQHVLVEDGVQGRGLMKPCREPGARSTVTALPAWRSFSA
ncbi:Uncharacterised protein [Mycobacteroides abscessus subsp. abscessus]|nr:Uncharacterised protein [Mycobacteroides abscessus subsp. abscessus]